MNRMPSQKLREEAGAISWEPNSRPACVGPQAGKLAEKLLRAVVVTWATCGAFEWVALSYLALT